MDELIKRSDAIKLLESLPSADYYHSNTIYTDMAIDAIESMPSADRPQGEWIDKGDHAECSNCGANSGTQFDGVEPVPRKTNFCPNCGAKMKGADDVNR